MSDFSNFTVWPRRSIIQYRRFVLPTSKNTLSVGFRTDVCAYTRNTRTRRFMCLTRDTRLLSTVQYTLSTRCLYTVWPTDESKTEQTRSGDVNWPHVGTRSPSKTRISTSRRCTISHGFNAVLYCVLHDVTRTCTIIDTMFAFERTKYVLSVWDQRDVRQKG